MSGWVSEGRLVALRPVAPADYEAIRAAELSSGIIQSYRHRGVAGSPESFAQGLWQGVLCQFVVCSRASGDGIGLVAAYDANFRAGHCSIAGFIHPAVQGVGWPLEGFGLLIDYLFANFNIHKLYADILDVNLHQMGSVAGRIFTLEGRLRDDEFIDGRYHDRLILGLLRDEWHEVRAVPTADRILGDR